MTAEEESIEQAANARRERLMAPRSAQQLSSTPDNEPSNPNGNNEAAAQDDSIEQAAAERRERLKALREAKELLSTPDGDSTPSIVEDSEETEEAKELNMKFRNYLPHDKQLQEGKLAPAVLPKFEDPVAAAPTMAEKIDPFISNARKKPNWDLRRDVQKRLDKLERRTQKAIHQLMPAMGATSNFLRMHHFARKGERSSGRKWHVDSPQSPRGRVVSWKQGMSAFMDVQLKMEC